MTISITNGGGPRNASQDRSGKRFYTWRGRRLPSVTSVPKLVGIPDRLHRWFVGNLIDHVITNVSAIGLRVATGDDRELESLKRDLWKAVQGEQTSRIVGIAVHRAAALGHSPDEVHQDIAPKLRQYLDWREKSGAQVLASEFQVWNLSEGYAGTVDLLVRFGDGSIWLLDIKTGKGVYAEAALQLMAYLMAEFAGTDDVIDEQVTEMLQNVSGIGILHLSNSHWEFISLRPAPETWTAFRGLLRFASWVQANDGLDGLAVARKRSDASRGTSPETLLELGWHWARIGSNVAHLVPPQGDAALCFRPVERPRRTRLDTQPDDACQRCQDRLTHTGAAA